MRKILFAVLAASLVAGAFGSTSSSAGVTIDMRGVSSHAASVASFVSSFLRLAATTEALPSFSSKPCGAIILIK